MIQRKTLLVLVVCIVGFTTVYLLYVKKERKESIARYLPDPHVGDIYKMETRPAGTGRESYYLLVKDVTAGSVIFYHGRMSGSYGANDIFLKDFDSSAIARYSKKDLEHIGAGQWDNDDHEHTTLLEISRK